LRVFWPFLLAPVIGLAQGKPPAKGKAVPVVPAGKGNPVPVVAAGAVPAASAPAAPTTPAAPTAAPTAATGAKGPPTGPVTEARKDEARAHFERGISLSDEESWDAALVEFSRSRELFATRGNTKNMALCLRKLRRFDESLDVYEMLLAEYPTMPAQDRAFVDKEIAELRKRVGTLAVTGQEGASVTVSGRTRGTLPLARPLRLSAGTHVVRVYKEGYLPFETRVELVGEQAATLEAKLEQLTQSGRLQVTEQSGKSVDVEVDHAIVGKTPWEGTLPPGDHTVLLRGEGNLGTQPSSVPIVLNQLATLTLAVEPLESEIRVEPSPSGATVAVDGVVVGRGLWVGRLRAGKHAIDVGAEGFLPDRRELQLAAGASEQLAVTLERDPNSPLWRRIEPSRLVVEAVGFGLFGTAIGGEISDSCKSGCTKGLAAGGGGFLRVGYELGLGIGLGLEAGGLTFRQHLDNRAETLSPVGLPANPGTVSDRLSFSGLRIGGAAWYHHSKRAEGEWGWVAGLGVGVLSGTMRDDRSGDFTTATAKLPGGAPVTYRISGVSESPSARYLYVAPRVQATYRVTQGFEIGFGIQLDALLSLSQPSWTDKQPLVTGSCGPVAAGCVTDGQARFGQHTIANATTFLASPVLSLRLDF
jgi:hypothetical protein